MIRIAYLFSTLEGFGLVKIIFALIKQLKKNPLFEIHVITLSQEPENSLISDFQKENIPIHCIGMSRLKGMFYAQKSLTRLLDDLKIDIVHSNGFRANLIHSQIEHKTKSKAVMTIHLDPNDDAKHPLGILFRLWRKNKHVSVIKKNKYSLACSRSISDALVKYNIHIPFIQNGIELDSLAEIKPFDIKKELGIPSELPLFVVLSGLHKRKNIDIVIQAFNKLGKDYPLVIIGDGPDRELLETMANKKHIYFLGYQKEATKYLFNSDIYISASSSEGLPLSVMEAMFMENIPILSSIPPHLELIENSSFNDYTFACEDIEAIMNICRSLVRKDLQTQKEEAKKLIAGHFSVNRMTEEYISLYKKII